MTEASQRGVTARRAQRSCCQALAATMVAQSPELHRSISTRGRRKPATCEHCDGESPPAASHPPGARRAMSSGASSTIPPRAMLATTTSNVPSMPASGSRVAVMRADTPLIAALRWAANTDSGSMSTATTEAAPSLRAQSPSTPLPHPTSSTRFPPAIRRTSNSMICRVVGCRPLPNPPVPSSINPGSPLRSCSDQATQTLTRPPNTTGRVSSSHRSSAAPPSGRATAISPSARSNAAIAAAPRRPPTAPNTTRRPSLGATTSRTRTPKPFNRSQTPTTAPPDVATAIISHTDGRAGPTEANRAV